MKKSILVFVVTCVLAVVNIAQANQCSADELSGSFEKLERIASELEQADKLDSYARMRLLVIDRFFDYLEIDRKAERTELVKHATKDLERMIASETERLERIQAGKISPMDAPRRIKDDYPEVVDGQLKQKVRWSDGTVEDRPIMLFGFGHFSGMRNDIEFLGKIGTNFCQTEFGPRHVRPKPGVWRKDKIGYMRTFFERSQKAGVLVDFLISPHYMPSWQYKKNPDWKVHLGGFLRYAINRPGVKEFIGETTRRMLRELTPAPAVWSVCLANEPVAFLWNGDKDTAPMWKAYLKSKHGSLDKLNNAWDTDYRNWDAIKPYRVPPKRPYEPSPKLHDWMRFNDKRLADWLSWLDGEVRSELPEVETHVKMIGRHWGQYNLLQGVDIDRFAEIGTLNGKDGGDYPRPAEDPDAKLLHATYTRIVNELLLSLRNKPIFNTENHMLRNRSTRPVREGHVRGLLWTQAISGLRGSVAWSWQRKEDDPGSIFRGLFQYRPGATEEYVRTGMDLMRLSRDVEALTHRPRRVAVLYSRTSMLRDPDAKDALFATFEALSGRGLNVTMVTEQQLATGLSDARYQDIDLLVLPGCTHLPDATFSGLEQFLISGFMQKKGAILVGSDIASKNEYHKRRSLDLFNDTGVTVLRLSQDATQSNRLFRAVGALGVRPNVKLIDTETGESVKGVWFAAAEKDNETIVTAINEVNHPVRCQWVDHKGNVLSYKDKLSSDQPEAVRQFTLKPLQVICGQIETPNK